MRGLIQMLSCLGLLLCQGALLAVDPAEPSLWEDPLQNMRSEPELGEAEIRFRFDRAELSALRGIFRGVLSDQEIQLVTAMAERHQWQALENFFTENSIVKLEDLIRRRGSARFSSLELAVGLRLYRHTLRRSAFRHAGRYDNLGYFDTARQILRESPSIDPKILSNYGMNFELGVLLGLHENPFIQHQDQIARISSAAVVYGEQIDRIAQIQGGEEAVKIMLLASLVNPASTQRLNQEELREFSDLREYHFSSNLADSIFQLANLKAEALRNFVETGRLPDTFKKSRSVAFTRLVENIQNRAKLRSIQKLSGVCSTLRAS